MQQFSFLRFCLALLAISFLHSNFALAQVYHSSKTHSIIVYNDGISSLEKRLVMIEGATRTIDIEYFLFDPHEDSARVLLQAAIKKARAGVQVNILVDGLGILVKFDPALVAELKRIPENKLQIKFFNPSFIFKQNRNHRKHLIVDGKEVITGGRNLEDKYFDMDSRYNFLDRDIWIKGPIVSQIKHSFDLIWNDHSISIPPNAGKVVEEIRIPKRRMVSTGGSGSQSHKWNDGEINQARRQLMKAQAARRVVTVTPVDLNLRKEIKFWAAKQAHRLGYFKGPVSYITDFFYRGMFNSVKKNRVIWHEIIKEMNNTDSSLEIESPYMVLTRNSFDLLRKLKSKDSVVHTAAMTNSPNSTDNKLTSTTYFGLSDDLAREGAQISVYDGKVPSHLEKLVPLRARNAKWGTHAKTMVADSQNTTIGTFNLDPRSKNLNLENVVWIPDQPHIAEFVLDDIKARKKQSYEFFVIDKNGKAHQKFSDCQDLDFTACIMLRLQRPFGFLLKRLL